MKKLHWKCGGLLVAFFVTAGWAANAFGGFNTFIIRNGNNSGNPPTIQTNNAYVAGATEFIISEGGMKAGWGSNDLNGYTIGQIAEILINRYDDTGRFTAGSGPAVAPYFNIWITNGTDYAVVANEPSNPAFQSLFETVTVGSLTFKQYNLSFDDVKDKTAKIYETSGTPTNTWVHQALGKVGQTLTFADLAGFQIAPPPASYISSNSSIGTGAPRELSTNTAYGFNWIFGDTLSNYVSGSEGYVVSGALAKPVPEPVSLVALGSLAGCGLVVRSLRRRTRRA